MEPANWLARVLGDSCVGCSRPAGPLCGQCAATVVPAASMSVPAGIARVVAAWSYDGVARALVLAAKERGRRACAVPLAEAAAGAVWRTGLDAEVLTWVPCRVEDRRRRGFDHGEVLARVLGARLGVAVAPLLGRTRVVRDQVGLSGTARRANLAGAFAARGAVPGRVAVVDDVLTTGATAAACAAALRRGGAGTVEVVAACRTR